ncbi:MAG: MFS transporter [Synoicihabitans sp.]
MNHAPRIPTRYKMVGGTFLLSMIVLFDRILISVAKDPVASELSLTDKQFGWVLSIFALGYALFQTPAGYLADRLGARKVLAAVVTLWSLFTALTGVVSNLISLLIVRFLFGVGEAGAFPGIARAIFRWIPRSERGLVNGINFSGGRIGAAIALPIVAWMIDLTGWRNTFLIMGALGVVWAIWWIWWFRDDPAEHPAISPREVDHITTHTHQDVGTDSTDIAWGKLFRSRSMWLLMSQYFCSNFTFFFCLTWLFPYLKTKYGLESLEAGFYSSAPLVFGALGNWVSGWLVDFIYRHNQRTLSRRIPAIIGFFLAATGVIASIFMEDVTGAVVCLSIAVFGADMTLSPSWSTCVDVGRHHSGSVSGTMNMAGNLGSFFTSLAFPYMLAFTGSAVPFFALTAVLNGCAIGLWLMIKPEDAMDIDSPTPVSP